MMRWVGGSIPALLQPTTMHRLFPEDVRRTIALYSDPAGDAELWSEWAYMYEEWGWYGSGGDSCPVCGLKTQYWLPEDQRPEEDKGRMFIIATGWQSCEQRFHWQPVCSKRCESWDEAHPVFTMDRASPSLTN